ncbi:MAG: peptidase M29 [Rhodobiaceae bacterium]
MPSNTPPTAPFEAAWRESFAELFALCGARADETITLLTETQSRQINIDLARDALTGMQLPHQTVTVPGKPQRQGPIIRSTGASTALTGEDAAIRELCDSDLVIDLTVEGLMHAPQTAGILQSGARIMTISNEHPEILSRLRPDPAMKDVVRGAVAACRAATTMTVTSPAGTELSVAMSDIPTVGVWGWTDRPGTLAHWPGGLVVSFPRKASCNGTIVFAPGDINLTFKRYFESEVRCVVRDDFITEISGDGSDAQLMKRYLEGFDDPLAFATSHVGWGLNPAARYEALTMYDKADLNGTELRALAGNFLYSTGANEFAGRFTEGHFDLPMMGCTISLDDIVVVRDGVPV